MFLRIMFRLEDCIITDCFGDTLGHGDNLFDTHTIEDYSPSHKATDFSVRI